MLSSSCRFPPLCLVSSCFRSTLSQVRSPISLTVLGPFKIDILDKPQCRTGFRIQESPEQNKSQMVQVKQVVCTLSAISIEMA